MKKVLGMLVVLGLIAAPAVADLPVKDLGGPSGATIGVWNGTSITPSDVVIPMTPSGSFTVTFGVHWPYATPVYANYVHHNLMYDVGEVRITGYGPAPGMTGYWGNSLTLIQNLITYATPTPYTTGTHGVMSLYETFITTGGATTVITLPGTGSFPLFKATFHALNPGNNPGQTYTTTSMTIYTTTTQTPGVTNTYTNTNTYTYIDVDVFMSKANVVFYTGGATHLWATAGGVASTWYSAHVTPEPASMSLLAIGVVALSGGIIRRRRR